LVPHTQVFPYFVELLALQHSNVILLHIPAFFFLLHIDLDSGGARAFSLDPSGASDGAFSVYNSTAYLGQGFKRMFQPLARKYVGSSTTASCCSLTMLFQPNQRVSDIGDSPKPLA